MSHALPPAWLLVSVSLVTACLPSRDTASTPGSAAASASTSAGADTGGDAPTPSSVAAPASAAAGGQAAPPELPRGGRTIFPDYRLVGFCGTPGAPALGPLLDHPAAKVEKLLTYANQYSADSRKIMPIFELIAIVVQGYPGNDGKYRVRVFDSVIDEYLQTARANKGLLLLNIQPGQSDFMTEVQRFEKYLHEPDVGVALDPEWAMLPKQPPGKFYGHTTGDAINQVIAYLSGIVAHDNLPEKALVFHMVNDYVVKDETAIRPQPGIAVIKSVDGLGPKGAKLITYRFLMKTTAPGVHAGFKLFFDEDRQNGGILMTPPEVMHLLPKPEYVMYE
jgi:hypothetical protein